MSVERPIDESAGKDFSGQDPEMPQVPITIEELVEILDRHGFEEIEIGSGDTD